VKECLHHLSPAQVAASLNATYDDMLVDTARDRKITTEQLVEILGQFHRERYIINRVMVIAGPTTLNTGE
jgi:hypothetical protein